ncbi:glycosyltransferase family 2 protein [bacterium]|nr:glycosyltransferase family 2 protein [bacterium]
MPVYHNNVWQASFFARVAAASNTFWQMMQQIRQEKLATYSSHSMTWRALADIGFWSKTMVSEDSRIFWHCFCYYNGDYRVVPLYYPVSMDVTMDETVRETAKGLYKQQRRWGWGVENIPYLIFNTIKRWRLIRKRRFLSRIFVQIYGFHSWATNALIIGIIGWFPLLLGGDRFNATVLSTNLPFITRTLMTIAMGGLILSAILSTLLLPKRPPKYGVLKHMSMLIQWLLLPLSIIIFGAFPGLEAQTRLMLGGKSRLGFFVTPKSR